MKRILSALLILTLLAAFAGCTSSEKDVDLTALCDSIVSETGVAEAMVLPAESLTDLYGIAPEDLADSGCCCAMGGSFPDEILMVRAVDAAALERILTSFNARLQDVLNQSANYDPDNYALAQTCKVLTKGNYAALFISANHEQMEQLFEAAMK